MAADDAANALVNVARVLQHTAAIVAATSATQLTELSETRLRMVCMHTCPACPLLADSDVQQTLAWAKTQLKLPCFDGCVMILA
jgi:hypothetical protein